MAKRRHNTRYEAGANMFGRRNQNQRAAGDLGRGQEDRQRADPSLGNKGKWGQRDCELRAADALTSPEYRKMPARNRRIAKDGFPPRTSRRMETITRHAISTL